MALLICLSPTLLANQPACEQPIPAFEAEYSVHRNGKAVGTALASLGPSGSTWHYQFKTDATRGLAALFNASVKEDSWFEWRQKRPRPNRYQYLQKVAFRERAREAWFDWDSQRVEGENRGKTWQQGLHRDLTDRLLVNLLLMLDLAAQRSNLSYPTIDKGRETELTFDRLGETTIDTVLGSINTLVLARQHRDPQRRTRSWHAPSAHFLTLRLEQIDGDDDEIVVMEISRFTSACPEFSSALNQALTNGQAVTSSP